jgi:hypothetical protein
VRKKEYIIPKVTLIELDYSISLQMQSQPIDPPPRDPVASGKKSSGSTFASPFGDKPFN